MRNDTQVQALMYVEFSAEEKERALQAFKTAHANLGSAGTFDPQFAPDRAWLEGYCYARAAVEASARQLAEHKPLFGEMIAAHPGLREEMLAEQAEASEPVRDERAEPVADGYKLIAVTNFDPLVMALDRAFSKGYLPDALEKPWADFDWEEVATPHTAPVLAEAWQPIETAPKDRTEILACWPKRKLDDDDCPTGEIVGYAQCVTAWQGFWIEPDYLEAHGSYYMEDEAFAAEPTHWMPLPPPPIEQVIGRASRGAK